MKWFWIIAVALLFSGTAYAQAMNTIPYTALGGLTNGNAVKSGGTAGQLLDGGGPPVTTTGNNTYTGTNLVTPITISAAGALDMTATGGRCGAIVLYTGATGTLTVGNTAAPGCGVTVIAAASGLATIAVTGGTAISNTACTANPRTKENGSMIFVVIRSNAGTAPQFTIGGDCG